MGGRRHLAVVLWALVFNSAFAQAATPGFLDYVVDLRKQTLRLYLNDKHGTPHRQFASLAQSLSAGGEQLVFAMNAGIFMEDLRPLGLYVESGKTIRPLNSRTRGYGNFYMQPNGVFVLSDAGATIVATQSYPRFASRHRVAYATQSGPLLVIEGKINDALPKSGGRKLPRNAVCVTQDGHVVLSLAEAPIGFREFAQHLKTTHHCKEALYLDGAISDVYWPKEDRHGRYGNFGPMFGVTGSVGR